MFKGRRHPGDLACTQAMRARNLAPLRDGTLNFGDDFSGRREFQAVLACHPERHVGRGGIVRLINGQREVRDRSWRCGTHLDPFNRYYSRKAI
ncbi:MAG: hypothetical protein WCH61_04945 [bacterium]